MVFVPVGKEPLIATDPFIVTGLGIEVTTTFCEAGKLIMSALTVPLTVIVGAPDSVTTPLTVSGVGSESTMTWPITLDPAGRLPDTATEPFTVNGLGKLLTWTFAKPDILMLPTSTTTPETPTVPVTV